MKKNNYFYVKGGLVESPLRVNVFPDGAVGGVHHSDEEVEHENVDDDLIDTPKHKAHQMREFH